MKLTLIRIMPIIALAVEFLAVFSIVTYSGTPIVYPLVWITVLAAVVTIVSSVVLFRRQRIVSVFCILVGAWILEMLFMPL
jgi:hypothetical protein